VRWASNSWAFHCHTATESDFSQWNELGRPFQDLYGVELEIVLKYAGGDAAVSVIGSVIAPRKSKRSGDVWRIVESGPLVRSRIRKKIATIGGNGKKR
jgi:hypothetical protein